MVFCAEGVTEKVKPNKGEMIRHTDSNRVLDHLRQEGVRDGQVQKAQLRQGSETSWTRAEEEEGGH